jgi:hypothetical protein
MQLVLATFPAAAFNWQFAELPDHVQFQCGLVAEPTYGTAELFP